MVITSGRQVPVASSQPLQNPHARRGAQQWRVRRSLDAGIRIATRSAGPSPCSIRCSTSPTRRLWPPDTSRPDARTSGECPPFRTSVRRILRQVVRLERPGMWANGLSPSTPRQRGPRQRGVEQRGAAPVRKPAGRTPSPRTGSSARFSFHGAVRLTRRTRQTCAQKYCGDNVTGDSRGNECCVNCVAEFRVGLADLRQAGHEFPVGALRPSVWTLGPH